MGETMRRAVFLNEAEAWVESITLDLQNKIIREWIQKDQLIGQGVDENGEIIGLYSAMTEQMSGGIKREGEHFTLEDTGQFFRSMFITVLATQIIINADFAKMEDQKWWRTEILGMTDENLSKFILEVKNGFIDYTRRILGVD